MHQTFATFSILILSGLCSSAFAQPRFGPGPERDSPPHHHKSDHTPAIVKALDTNADGIISKEEIASAAQSLSAMDKNNDGRLTPEEFHPHPDPFRHDSAQDALLERLVKCDKNQDNQISKQEITPDLAVLFQATDENHDGIVTSDEIRRSKDRNHRTWQKKKGTAFSSGMVNFIMRERDNNKDGKLTGEEIPERLKEKMEMIDGNKDGEIDPSELEQLAKHLMSRAAPQKRSPKASDRPQAEK